MQNPKVSVLVPVYNCAKFLPKTLESILAQDYENFEVVVTDNCSTDGSGKIARDYAKKDSRVRVVGHEENIGYVKNLNSGLREAVGDYIAFLHADDLWQPNFLSSSIELFGKNPDAGMCFCRYENIDSEGRPHSVRARNALEGGSRALSSDELFEMYVGRDFTPVCTVIVARKAQQAAGEYDIRFQGPCDYQMWLKIAYNFGGIYNSRSTSKYRIHSASGFFTQHENNVLLTEQYIMSIFFFAEYATKQKDDARYKKMLLRNTALSALRQSVDAISKGKGEVARRKSGFCISCYGGVLEQLCAVGIFFASFLTFVLAPIFGIIIKIGLPVLKRLKLY